MHVAMGATSQGGLHVSFETLSFQLSQVVDETNRKDKRDPRLHWAARALVFTG